MLPSVSNSMEVSENPVETHGDLRIPNFKNRSKLVTLEFRKILQNILEYHINIHQYTISHILTWEYHIHRYPTLETHQNQGIWAAEQTERTSPSTCVTCVVSCRCHPVIQEHLQETRSFFSKKIGFLWVSGNKLLTWKCSSSYFRPYGFVWK